MTSNICPLNIDLLEPYFLWQFGIRIPGNLKPVTTKLNDLSMHEEDWFNAENMTAKFDELRRINVEESTLYGKPNLECTEDCLTSCRKFSGIEREIDYLQSNVSDVDAFNSFWSNYPRLLWLTNKLGSKKQITGLPVKNLEELEEGVYQIGMQETSTKEYFRYISTSKGRRVNIRMLLFNQYQGVQNTGSKKELADFFSRFNHFEDLIKGSYQSILFHLDIYGDSLFKIRTLDGVEVQDEKFGFDIDFNIWAEKIIT